MINSSCSTSGIHLVTLVTNQVIFHEWGKDIIVITTKRTYSLPYDVQYEYCRWIFFVVLVFSLVGKYTSIDQNIPNMYLSKDFKVQIILFKLNIEHHLRRTDIFLFTTRVIIRTDKMGAASVKSENPQLSYRLFIAIKENNFNKASNVILKGANVNVRTHWWNSIDRNV